MHTSSITTNTDNTSCYGTLQVSNCTAAGNCNNAFSTCVQMSAAPVASNDNKTFTIDPSSVLAIVSAKDKFKIKVTTGAKDTSGNALAADNETTFQTVD